MPNNQRTFFQDKKKSRAEKKVPTPRDRDYISKLGYSDNSPFRNRPYIDIHTPNGLIDMSNTGIPLLANGQYLPPYSGMYDLGSPVVREVPVAKTGGWLDKYGDKGEVKPEVMYRVVDPNTGQEMGYKQLPEFTVQYNKAEDKQRGFLTEDYYKRAKELEENPSKYNVTDYIKYGISEPGASAEGLADPLNWASYIAMGRPITSAIGAIGEAAYPYVSPIVGTLDAPAVIGGKQIPWLTANNLMAGYFGSKIPENIQSGEYLTAGLNALPFAIPAAESAYNLGKTYVPKLGEYLTEETALKNAYKINPLAFKTQEGKIYRQIGEPGFQDLLQEGKVYAKGQKEFLENYPEFDYLDQYNKHINTKGFLLEKPAPAPFFSRDELFMPISRSATGKGDKLTKFSDAKYLLEGDLPNEALLPRYRDSYLKDFGTTNTGVLRPEYSDLQNFNLYKRDWLMGYKPTTLSNETKNLHDLKYASDWAKQYGYNLPADLERIAQSDELTNRTIRGLVDRHNTFVRGVSTNWDELQKRLIAEHGESKGKEIWDNVVQNFKSQGIDYINNPKAAAEYMATHVPISTGYGRASLPEDVFNQGLEGLYTSNSIPTAEGYTYGQGYYVKGKLPTDYSSSNRRDWILKNSPEYYEHDLPGGNSILIDGKVVHPSELKTGYMYNLQDYPSIGHFKNKVIQDLEEAAERSKFAYERAEGKNPIYVQNTKKHYEEIQEQLKNIKNQTWEKYEPRWGKKLLKTEHTPEKFGDIYGTWGQDAETIANKLSASSEEGATHTKNLIDITKSVGKDTNGKISDLTETYIDLLAKGENNLSPLEKEQLVSLEREIENLKFSAKNKVEQLQADYLSQHFPGWENQSDKFAHYIHIGKPGEKILEPVKSWEIIPSNYKNKSRSHSNRYSKKLSAMSDGGWLDNYMYGGDPSLPNITGHYPFGGQQTKTHTHMQGGGQKSYWIDLPLNMAVPNIFDKRFWEDEWYRTTQGNLLGDFLRSPFELKSTEQRVKELKERNANKNTTWLDRFQIAGEVKNAKKDAPFILRDQESSWYDPQADTIYLGKERGDQDLGHEMYHRQQVQEGRLRLPQYDPYGEARKQPTITEEETDYPYFNRRLVDKDILTNDFLYSNPSFIFANPDAVYNLGVNRNMYNTPWTAEGEADATESEAGRRYLERMGIAPTYKTGGWLSKYDDGGVGGVGTVGSNKQRKPSPVNIIQGVGSASQIVQPTQTIVPTSVQNLSGGPLSNVQNKAQVKDTPKQLPNKGKPVVTNVNTNNKPVVKAATKPAAKPAPKPAQQTTPVAKDNSTKFTVGLGEQKPQYIWSTGQASLPNPNATSIVQNIEDLIELGWNGVSRKLKTFVTGDTTGDVEVNDSKPLDVNTYYSKGNDNIVSSVIDAPGVTNGRQFKQQTLNASKIKFGYRNRGQYPDTPIETDGLEITAFDPFTDKKLPDNRTVLALDPQGRLHTGKYGDFKNQKGFLFSPTIKNNIIDFEEKDGQIKYKHAEKNPEFNLPVVKVIDDTGKEVSGSVNMLIKNNNTKKFFGDVQGGRILFVNPKTKEQYLISGSVDHIIKEFRRLKGDNKYLEAYALDNGTYVRGLSFKDKKLTKDRLRSYDNENTSGGNGLYIMGYDTPVQNYQEEYVQTPNVRTEKDDSFKKGHKLKNEVKNVVLHHTAYVDPETNEKEVRDQYMTPGKNTSHVVIEEDGKRTVYASPEQVTFHAGFSRYNNRDDVNDFSIGVEFQGDTNKKPLTDAQVKSFVEYYAPIAKKYNLSLKDIITHQMIRENYRKKYPNTKNLETKEDISQKDYQRILKYMSYKGFKKLGGEINWLDKYE